MPASEVFAIIPARGGSRGIPRKNLADLGGKPLITHTITAASDSGKFSRVIVSTDDPEIAAVSRNQGAEVILRSAALATDTSLMVDVIRDLAQKLTPNDLKSRHFCLLQPTSPLRTAVHIRECFDQFQSGNFQSAVSVRPAEETPYKMLSLKDDCLEPLFGYASLAANRQSLPKAFLQNGAIYITPWTEFLAQGSFVVPKAMAYLMSAEDSTDIDTPADLGIAAARLGSRNTP